MSGDAKIFVFKDSDHFKVKVDGRATFSVAPTMRSIVQRLNTDNEIKHLSVDLTECSGMDSTFMGILTQLALSSNRHYSEKVKITNPGEANKKLLHGLGLDRLFEYVDTQGDPDADWQQEEARNSDYRENAETVLNAHKTLIEAVPANREKFAGVVTQVEKDLK